MANDSEIQAVTKQPPVTILCVTDARLPTVLHGARGRMREVIAGNGEVNFVTTDEGVGKDMILRIAQAANAVAIVCSRPALATELRGQGVNALTITEDEERHSFSVRPAR